MEGTPAADAEPTSGARPADGPVDVASELASLDALLAADPAEMGDEECRLHALALHVARARVDAAVVAASGAVDARGLHRADGARSAPAWLAGRVGDTKAHVAAEVRLARALRHMPGTAAAFAAGRITQVQAQLLAAARTDAVADVFATMEDLLVDQVSRLTAHDTAVVLRSWLEKARLAVGDVDPDEPADPTAPRTAVDLDRTFDGRWALAGEMDAEHGTVLRSAIDAEVDALFRAGTFRADDGLTPAERRGEALALLIARRAQAQMRHDRPRPSVEVICDERTLLGLPVTDPDLDDGDDLARRTATYADGTPVALTTLSRLLCGADVHRIVVAATGEVLDVGKDSRRATRAQRRALRHRHGGHCAFPGCAAPFDWCEAHHVEHWDPDPASPRGPTDLLNLAPFCPFHHHRVHDEGYIVTVRADGTIHVARPPDPGGGRCPVTPARPHPQAVDPHPDALAARHRIRALVTTAQSRRSPP